MASIKFVEIVPPDRIDPARWSGADHNNALKERRKMIRHVRLLHVLAGVLRRQERQAVILPGGASSLLIAVENALEIANQNLATLIALIEAHEGGRHEH